jgi:hypothetical protein
MDIKVTITPAPPTIKTCLYLYKTPRKMVPNSTERVSGYIVQLRWISFFSLPVKEAISFSYGFVCYQFTGFWTRSGFNSFRWTGQQKVRILNIVSNCWFVWDKDLTFQKVTDPEPDLVLRIQIRNYNCWSEAGKSSESFRILYFQVRKTDLWALKLVVDSSENQCCVRIR